ncbi:MAG: hypothetical protein VW226_13425, partial [Rhodospirillaceae bacterium]
MQLKKRNSLAWLLVLLCVSAPVLPLYGSEVESIIIELKNGTLAGENFALSGGKPVSRIRQGKLVKILLSSDTKTTIHLHGYNLKAVVKPKTQAVIKFKAEAAGRFPIETHGSDGSHKTLLYIEVR